MSLKCKFFFRTQHNETVIDFFIIKVDLSEKYITDRSIGKCDSITCIAQGFCMANTLNQQISMVQEKKSQFCL